MKLKNLARHLDLLSSGDQVELYRTLIEQPAVKAYRSANDTKRRENERARLDEWREKKRSGVLTMGEFMRL